MAIEGAAATVPLSPGERLNGLNHIAELRAKVFGLNIESELERFIKDMRDPRDINSEQNKRALAAIFFMAKIPAERHSISINELTTDEKRELIKAMNLTEARLEERRARAEAMAARLDSLACHITSRQLNHVEAAELLRVTAEAIQNEAQEIH